MPSQGDKLGGMLVEPVAADWTWFCSGSEIYPAMLAAIEAARESVCLETYIYAADSLGERFREALATDKKVFLAAQHCFLPLILDGRFLLWRLGMYLPFALFAGLMLKLRPSLLPYMVIVHGLIDISTLSVYWMV